LFLEFEACVASGLNLWKWWNNEYSVDFKAFVVAWFQDHNAVKLHSEDAVNRKMKQMQKKK